MTHTLWPRLLQWLLVLALPVLLVAADVRFVTGHWFVHWEYGKADSSPDPFGLSTADRTRLAETSVDYLATNTHLALLADLRLPGGAPAFNARELRHMADVQVVYNRIMTAGIAAALVLLGGMATLLASGHTRWRAPAALLGGSMLTLGLLGAIGAFMTLDWWDFFTAFHRLFFEGDTWLFLYSDTLIRLFPMRFWMDVAVVIAGLLVAEAVVLGVVGWTWMRRRCWGRVKREA